MLTWHGTLLHLLEKTRHDLLYLIKRFFDDFDVSWLEKIWVNFSFFMRISILIFSQGKVRTTPFGRPSSPLWFCEWHPRFLRTQCWKITKKCLINKSNVSSIFPNIWIFLQKWKILTLIFGSLQCNETFFVIFKPLCRHYKRGEWPPTFKRERVADPFGMTSSFSSCPVEPFCILNKVKLVLMMMPAKTLWPIVCALQFATLISKTKVQKLDEVMMITFNSTEIEFPALFWQMNFKLDPHSTR